MCWCILYVHIFINILLIIYLIISIYLRIHFICLFQFNLFLSDLFTWSTEEFNVCCVVLLTGEDVGVDIPLKKPTVEKESTLERSYL